VEVLGTDCVKSNRSPTARLWDFAGRGAAIIDEGAGHVGRCVLLLLQDGRSCKDVKMNVWGCQISSGNDYSALVGSLASGSCNGIVSPV
jgi:hypothetical protein